MISEPRCIIQRGASLLLAARDVPEVCFSPSKHEILLPASAVLPFPQSPSARGPEEDTEALVSVTQPGSLLVWPEALTLILMLLSTLVSML